MGKDALYCGKVPAATKMKLVVNMVMGAQLAAIAEGITLAEASGCLLRISEPALKGDLNGG